MLDFLLDRDRDRDRSSTLRFAGAIKKIFDKYEIGDQILYFNRKIL